MRMTAAGGTTVYTVPNFELDLAEMIAAIPSGNSTRVLAAAREHRVMLGSALLNDDMRAAVSRLTPALYAAMASASIT